MRLKFLLLVFLLCAIAPLCKAQEAMSLKDTVKEYNKQRIMLNFKGMKVLGVWGIANIAAGGAGCFIAKNDEWKYFHGMNAAWGIVNTGIAAYGINRCRKQAAEKVTTQGAYDRYKKDKKALLINLGLDAAYAGTGALLVQYADKAKTDQDVYRGVGRSLVVQGVFLLAFDNLLFAAHQKYNSRWAVILDEMRFSGTGFSYVHTFR